MGAEQSGLRSSLDNLNNGRLNELNAPSPVPAAGLNSVSLHINGEPYTVPLDEFSSCSPTTRLVDFIRDRALLKGTKYMCREGGCGACVVSVTGKDSVTGAEVVKSANSCLVPLLSCDGWDITTIEKLGSQATGYNPIQKEMVKLGGTQCGFCTPGMIMHMYSFLHEQRGHHGPSPKPSAQDIEDSLDGNVCRCTGYRPILDAFKSFGAPAPAISGSDSGCFDIEDVPSCPMKAFGSGSPEEEFELLQYEASKILKAKGEVWVKATSLYDAFDAMRQFATEKVPYRVVAGNTSTGIYKHEEGGVRAFIDILNIHSLSSYVVTSDEIMLGSCVTITSTINILKAASEALHGFEYAEGVSRHLKRVANTSVRNIATIGGSLVMKHNHREFPSDVCTVLEAVGALIKIGNEDHSTKMYTVHDFLFLNLAQNPSLLLSVHLKPLRGQGTYFYRSYKVSKRYQNSLPVVNAAFLFHVMDAGPGHEHAHEQSFRLADRAAIVFGGINPHFLHADRTEAVLNAGKSLTDSGVVQHAVQVLGSELDPDHVPLVGAPWYRKLVAQALLYKAILSVLGNSSAIKPEFRSGGWNLSRRVTSGVQNYDTDRKDWPLYEPLPKLESWIQCSGEAEYINDIAPEPNELFGAFVLSTVANADIPHVDASEALKIPDVVRFVQAKDIPGKNDYMIGYAGIPEPIFADGKVGYAGQPIGLVLAKSRLAAEAAARRVKVSYVHVKTPVLTIREALKEKKKLDTRKRQSPKEETVEPPPSEPKAKSTSTQIKGEFEIGPQYHFHMETQVCICKPKEGGMDVLSSTQWMDFVQTAVAAALGLPQHAINVQVRRCGGAYGAKISRASLIAAAAAVGAWLTNRPIRVTLSLEENMEAVGKRPPYMFDYDVRVEAATGKIEALACKIYNDAGLYTNEETYTGAQAYMVNCYDSTSWTITGETVNTNTASNTWCRAPATTQGIAIIEYIMEHIAFATGIDPVDVRKANFHAPTATVSETPAAATNSGRINFREVIRAGSAGAGTSSTQFGFDKVGLERLEESSNSFKINNEPLKAPPKQPLLLKMIDDTISGSEYHERHGKVHDFNKANRWKKQGIALIPMRYPLAYIGGGFPILIAVYKADGTVALSHGGIECGQGINTKVAQVVAKELGIRVDQVAVKPANNLIGANAEVTGGSETSELCCYAALRACEILKARMQPVQDKLGKHTPWAELVQVCAGVGIDLTVEYMYSKNDPVYPYDIWAVNVTEVEIDVLTGEYKIVRVDLLEDAGKSLNPEIDVGQVEGALVMGLGLWATEKLVYDPQTGQLLTNDSLYYMPPEPRDIPEDLRVTLLRNAPNPLGVLRSKATGEPATCTSVCALFALRNAIQAARLEAGNTDWFQINGPVSTEDVLRLCLTASTQFRLL